MAERKIQRQIRSRYSYDRLATQKLCQAYRILVPFPSDHDSLRISRSVTDEDSSHLRAGVDGQTEGGADHRQPDIGLDGVCPIPGVRGALRVGTER